MVRIEAEEAQDCPSIDLAEARYWETAPVPRSCRMVVPPVPAKGAM